MCEKSSRITKQILMVNHICKNYICEKFVMKFCEQYVKKWIHTMQICGEDLEKRGKHAEKYSMCIGKTLTIQAQKLILYTEVDSVRLLCSPL